MSDKQPKLVIKVESETGDEILTVTIAADIAGRFLEYLGTQLRPPAVVKQLLTLHIPPQPHISNKAEGQRATDDK